MMMMTYVMLILTQGIHNSGIVWCTPYETGKDYVKSTEYEDLPKFDC